MDRKEGPQFNRLLETGLTAVAFYFLFTQLLPQAIGAGIQALTNTQNYIR